jgi:hypothetical protein
MDDIDEIQAQMVDRFYLLTIGIGRTRNRLLLTTQNLSLAYNRIPLFLHSSNGAWKIYELLFING